MFGLAFLACLAGALVAVAPAEATITSITVSNQSKMESDLFSGVVATFNTDHPGDSFAATIDWGDGVTSTGTVTTTGASRSVSGSHTYAEEGSYTLKVTVTETGSSPSTKSASATFAVSEGSFGVTGLTATTLTEGDTFSGTVATFTDSGSSDNASSYTAKIDWGDGTTTVGTITGSAGNFTVTGNHTYTDELSNGTIGVTIAEGSFSIGPVQDQITVSEADMLTGHPATFAVSDGAAFTGTVATFSDTSTATPASGFTATINWGDGTITSGTVTRSGGTLSVSGNHTFHSAPGAHSVNVTLSDKSPGTASATAVSTANVSAGEPSAATQGATNVTTNGATLNGAVDPNAASTTYSFQYGPSTGYGSSTPSTGIGSGTSSQAVSASLSGLAPGTTYHYRLEATNSKGTTFGADQTFTTIGPPTVSIASPIAGTKFAAGEKVAAVYTCQDSSAGPGLTSCTGTVPNDSAIDTSGAGPHMFVVTATSKDGLTTRSTVAYTVLPPLHISHPKRRRHGSFLIVVTAPGPGQLGVRVTAQNKLFGRVQVTATDAGTLQILVGPGRRGRRLLKHDSHLINLRISVTFVPLTGHATTITFRGLHPRR